MTPEEARHRWVKKAQEISRLLNSDKARAALIGRAAFNLHLGRQMLATADLDFPEGSRRLSSPSGVEEAILNGDVIVVRLPQEQLEAIIAKPAKQEDRCQKDPSSC